MCKCVLILLSQNDQAHKLLGAGFREALFSTLLPQTIHEVKDSLTAQNLVTHIRAQHDAGLVLKDGGHESRPNRQPANRFRQAPMFNYFPTEGKCHTTHLFQNLCWGMLNGSSGL